jgi:hypothetical protein
VAAARGGDCQDQIQPGRQADQGEAAGEGQIVFEDEPGKQHSSRLTADGQPELGDQGAKP